MRKFINTLAAGATGKDLLKVGKGLEPCTKDVTHVQCTLKEGQPRIVFVDTPPFPNPDERLKDSERAVERKIGDWLRKA